MITVHYYGELRRYTQKEKELFSSVFTVRGLLKQIKKCYGTRAYTLCKQAHLIVDKENILFQKGLSTKLSKDSTVEILPVCGGG